MEKPESVGVCKVVFQSRIALKMSPSQESPTAPPQSMPTGGGGGGEGTLDLEMTFHTDDWPEENDFFLFDENDPSRYIWDEYMFEPNRLYNYQVTLDASSCYALDFYDHYGDGLVGDGFLEIIVDGESQLRETSELGSGFIFYIGACDGW